ncbi:MAG: prepilin peptidase [Bdellovibrionales bacterium]
MSLDLESLVLLFLFFVLGSMIGSFLNVVIYRWPREESFVTPRSKCPRCKAPIPIYLNIPILSWLMLLGKANCCGDKINMRYPLVEFLTGASFAFTFYKFGLTFETFEYCLFLGMAIPCFFIDLEHYLLPDIFTITGIFVGFAGSFMSLTRSPVDSFLGLFFGGGLFWFTAWFFEKVRKKEGLGFGDVKLIAWLGALGGLSSIPFILMASGFAGSLVGLFLVAFKGGTRNTALPFGPFLISSAVVYFYFLEDLQGLFPYLVGFLL